MASKIGEDAQDCYRPHRLFFFVLIVIVVVIVVVIIGKIAVFVEILIVFFLDLILIVLFIHFIRNGVQSDRMSLRHLQFGLAFGAGEDFPLLDFVFIHVNFRGTLRAAEHVSILRVDLDKDWRRPCECHLRRIIYRSPTARGHSLAASSVTQPVER
jgi:hypothetical protein